MPAEHPRVAASRRDALVEGLRHRIRAIERGALPREAGIATAGPPVPDGAVPPGPQHPPPAAAASWTGPPQEGAWTLGVGEIDRRLGPGGLERAGVHEIKPAVPGAGLDAAGARAAAFAFLLRLAARSPERPGGGPIVCCRPLDDVREGGELHGPGLADLGLDPARLVLVATANAAETLWALEETLRSGSARLAVGLLGDAGLTPARRLALAAAAGRTPCLLLTHAAGPGLAATATRWRAAALAGAPHRLDPRAPGPPRCALALERARRTALPPDFPPVAVEWCDVTHRFRLAAALADRAPRAQDAGRRAG